MSENTLMPVPFHGDTIFCVEHNGQPFAPVKPIVENIGVDWKSQYNKLVDNAGRWGMVMITIPTKGGQQEMVCVPVRKLPAFLASINPDKVKEEIRPKLVQYQEECDDVLWQYWTTGIAAKKTAHPYDIDARMRAAALVFECAGLKGNQLALAMDKYYRVETGVPLLASAGVALVSERQKQLLTTTEIGKLLEPAKKAQEVNLLLAGLGYQKKVADKWEPTQEGLENGAELLDTGKRHSNGTPICQLKWRTNVVDVLKSLSSAAE